MSACASFRRWGIACSLAMVVAALPARAAEGFRVPPPVTRKLENGLQVAVFRMPRLPIVQIQLAIDAGVASEPEDALGVASVTAQLLLRGTSSRSAGAYAVEVDALGGNIDATATRDYATLDGAFLARDLDAGLELMSDAVINPLISDGDLRQIETAAMRRILDVRRSPGALADEQLWSAVFAGHPYGRPLTGSAESVVRMNRERVLGFYLSQYRPERATLAIAGDVDPERAFAAAQEWFGRWVAKAAAPAAPAGDAARASRLTIRIIDLPGAPVTQVRLGSAAPARGTDDEAAFSLINALLGGSPSSRWTRSPTASASNARSAYSLLKKGGLFASAFSAPHDSVAVAVNRLRQSMRDFLASPPDEAELAPVRATAVDVFPMRFETLGGVAGYWSGVTYAGLSADASKDIARVGAVKAADVAAVARRWLDPDRLAVVAVGPASRLKPILEKLGPVEVVSLEEARALGAGKGTSADRQARAREVVKLALAAHGGLARLKRIQDTTVEAQASVNMGEQEVQGEIVQIRKEPDRMRVNMHFSGVATIQAIFGNRGWTGSEASIDTRDMDSVTVAGMRSGFGSDVHHLLLATQAPGVILLSRGRESIAGQNAEAVEMRHGSVSRVLYFDVQTNRLIAMDQNESSSGVGFTARRLFGEYRQVQGIPWPYLEERLLEGRRVMLLEVRRVVLDSGIEDAVFERHGSMPPLPAR
jgi:predicted Zn-dependent peptidase